MPFARRTAAPQELPLPQAAVREFDLFADLFIATDGTTNWFDHPLDLPELTRLGPYLAGVTAVTTSKNDTDYFEWKVTCRWSPDGVQWSAPADLFGSLSSGPGFAIQNEFTTRTAMGPYMQYSLSVKNASGALTESALVSCTCYFRFLT